MLWYLAYSSLFLARNNRTLRVVPLGNSVGILILPGPSFGSSREAPVVDGLGVVAVPAMERL